MLYCNGNKCLFHIHIPRNGGRFIREVFSKNSFNFYFASYDQKFQGIEIPHLHYPLYLNLERVEESDHFAVVRNPFDRFKSSMQLMIRSSGYSEEIYEIMKDKDWLFSFLDMEKNTNSYYTNQLRNQKEFISEKTKIWRFENGLGDDFINWLNQNFDLQLVQKEYNVNYHIGIAETLPIKKQIDPSVEELIKEYYEEDYEYFNY